MACEFDPTKPPYDTLGQFHCPLCSEMVVGSFPHPDYDVMNDPNWEGWKELEESNRRQAEGRFDPYDGPLGF